MIQQVLTGPLCGGRDLPVRQRGMRIIVTEVGQHQMWAAQYYKYQRAASAC